MSSGVVNLENYIGGNFILPTTDRYIDVLDPAIPDKVIARCGVSAVKDVELAVEAAKKALPAWSQMTMKARAAIMIKFHSILQREAEELAKIIVLENGKNITEALADGTFMERLFSFLCKSVFYI